MFFDESNGKGSALDWNKIWIFIWMYVITGVDWSRVDIENYFSSMHVSMHADGNKVRNLCTINIDGEKEQKNLVLRTHIYQKEREREI